MEQVAQDLRFGFRMLLRNPLVNTVAILSLALGIGANSAIFSLANSVLLEVLPGVARPERLAAIYTKTRFSDYSATSYPDFKSLRDGNRSFAPIVARQPAFMNLGTADTPERIQGELVSYDYFTALGVATARGRTFLPQDDEVGAHPVAVVSHDFWQRRLGGDPALLDKNLLLNGKRFQVVGVAPAGFRGVSLETKSEVWVPTGMSGTFLPEGDRVLTQRGLLLFKLFGRLRPSVSLEQAQADLAAIRKRLNEQFPAPFRRGVVLVPAVDAGFSPDQRMTVSRMVWLLVTVVGLVLLIACVNLANLMLARATRRRREISVRQAMGASRLRLVRQLLTESLLLGLIGGAAGLLVARLVFPVLTRFRLPASIVLSFGLNGRVFAFALLLSLLTGVLVGLAPALQTTRPSLMPALKDAAPAPSRSRTFGLRGLFVVAQFALSLLLLVGAGLFLETLARLQSIDPGFNPRRLAAMSLDLGLTGFTDEQAQAFLSQLTGRVAALPGVRAVSVSSALPVEPEGSSVSLFFDARPQEGQRVGVNLVDVGYFSTVGLPLVRGRDFTVGDRGTAPPVCIVNQTLAERFWPHQEPLGKRMRFSGPEGKYLEVVGVARDSKYETLREEAKPFLYLPQRQVFSLFDTTKHLLVRTAGDPAPLFAPIRREVHALSGTLALFDVMNMSDYLSTLTVRERQTALLLSVFALLALLLAAIGLYGVMSYSVSQRTHEIGIRIALGAGRAELMRQIVGESAQLLVVGGIVGLLASRLSTRWVAGLLYGVRPDDLATLAAAAVVLALVGLAASLLPARRAARLDPTFAMRQQ
ncbi:MAG TPA: ABC transporter permease [Thermoanaerobaculia bacterium]|nr:ABC transporter permease [Thermoanaerobaculia bacterium]